MVGTYHHKFGRPLECTISRVNPTVNYGLWMMMCQCRFIDYSKCARLIGDVSKGRGYECVGAGGTYTGNLLFTQIFCEPKTALKKKSIFKNQLTTCVGQFWSLYFVSFMLLS